MKRRVLKRLVLALACAAPLPLGACMGSAARQPTPVALTQPPPVPAPPGVPLANPLILGVH